MSLRSWATPLAAGAFLVVSVTGVLMFFHLDTGLNKVVHEWLSWAFLAAVGAHLALNWRPFSTYFRRPLARAIMAGGAAALALSFLVPAGGAGDLPMRQIVGSLTHAPISALATLTGQDQAQLLASLADGHPGARADQSLVDLSGGDSGAALGLLAQVYATPPAQ